jgi:hypothetical protein
MFSKGSPANGGCTVRRPNKRLEPTDGATGLLQASAGGRRPLNRRSLGGHVYPRNVNIA